MKDSIVIVAVCDNHYAILLAALTKSIELNHHTGEKIILFIIEDNVSNENKMKLIRSISEEVFRVKWIPLNKTIPEHIKLPLDNSSWPLSVYARLFIPNFIDKDVSKVIYLDVDMILQKEISELWSIDLGDNVVGAVRDSRVEIFGNNWGGGVKNYAELGLAAELPYFNTGILLIDIEKWKKEDIGAKVVKCISKNIQYANFPDQYGLNVVLAEKWLALDPLWNHFADTPSSIKPNIVHYIAKKPIYKETNAINEFKELFYFYLGQTAWADFKPRSTIEIYIKKARNKLIKKWRKLFKAR
ncbi:glycosyltransferase family 8 protein [Marivirga lumbricoides]|uniref:Glycosyltransferase family 8 protein n=1 Tax=Marivirga lumbricoides TaxID=1046115 RepID=A0A2T4DRV7_9BACT|nr:glycosyltransferase family 8 protein [Marivirga lumbricoides]